MAELVDPANAWLAMATERRRSLELSSLYKRAALRMCVRGERGEVTLGVCNLVRGTCMTTDNQARQPRPQWGMLGQNVGMHEAPKSTANCSNANRSASESVHRRRKGETTSTQTRHHA